MTVIWLVPSSYVPNIGGVEEHVARVAAGLQDRGHDLRVIVNRWPADLATHEIVDAVTVHRLPLTQPGRSPLRLIRHGLAVPRLQRALDTLPRPDIVNLHCLASQTGHLSRWSRRHEIPLVLSTHGETAMDSGRTYERDPYQRAALRIASRQAAAFTACSAWARHETAGYAARFATGSVIQNGVDAAELADLPEVTEPVFAAYGRQVREKGFDRVVDAMQEVRRRLPGARLLLAGDGPEMQALRAGLGPNDEHRGRLDRAGVRQLLASVRIVVVPSRVEPFGIVAREALAAGRRLVYSRVGGLHDAADGFGIGVDAGDPGHLVDAMVAAHEDDVQLPGTDVLDRWSWEHVVTAYENLYYDVLSGR